MGNHPRKSSTLATQEIDRLAKQIKIAVSNLTPAETRTVIEVNITRTDGKGCLGFLKVAEGGASGGGSKSLLDFSATLRQNGEIQSLEVNGNKVVLNRVKGHSK
jgi:hypothetical protein